MQPDDRRPGTNWAGNHLYRATRLHRPANLDELRDVVTGASAVHVLGSRHSFNGIADAEDLVSLEVLHTEEALPPGVAVDRAAGTVSFGAGLKYGELVGLLQDEELALHNLASLPHISVAGAVATATHGSGVGNGNLATAVAAVELLTSDGELRTFSRDDADFEGVVVGLGALGVVTRLTLDVQPAFQVRQRVFERLPFEALCEHFDEIVSAAYSVSVFTHWEDDVEQVWLKIRDGEPEPDELFGATPATVDRHVIRGLDATPCTPQLGRPGPWSDRLPHFRMGFTPSAGEELQSEWMVPRDRAVEALQAVRSLSDRIRPLLLVCEIRTVAADRLWMSMNHERDSVGLHFTWVRDQEAVEELLRDLEAALAPFGARPHWGKVFTADASAIAPLYPRHADFVGLVERLDPRGVFRNEWLERRVLASV
ncbi:D-arabinono-1,4-lactone oxidase [Blastococcus litoris]|uniref:D-arabinono-1,4-lactone oxidase n=1 Tax=Blastococcus litoris TaxID=2171622 RepID=UPI000E30A5A8|nr:D-arabinono-1,4-lactone oxidase [Blastococcus litoris]